MATGDRCPAFADGGSDAMAAAVEDLPADVLGLVLRSLDGASLAALGSSCSGLRGLAADPAAWRALCLAAWPSARGLLLLLPCGDAEARRLFADAFPFPALLPWPSPSPPPAAALPPLPARLVSAVDLHHGGACVMSRVVDTDASSPWFLGAPFRVDALVQEGFSAPSPPPIAPADLSLSWILLDPASGRAVNASSRRPVSVDRGWLAGETVVRFTVVLGGVALDAAVACDERRGHVREVSLRMEDGDGRGVSGREGLAVVAAAMVAARQGRRRAETAARARYEEFVRGRAARKERRARRDGIIDLCCSAVGAAAFLGFLLMLTFR